MPENGRIQIFVLGSLVQEFGLRMAPNLLLGWLLMSPSSGYMEYVSNHKKKQRMLTKFSAAGAGKTVLM
jgi:hypothetical protein